MENFVIEKEMSYSVNFSQDLLYKILNAYIVPNYKLEQQYLDLYDENEIRTRIFYNDDKISSISSIKKIQLKHEKFAYWFANGKSFVPLIWRESKETKISYKTISSKLNKIIKVYVYKCKNVEIKFEHVYFSKSDIDSFDSTMANKIVKLLNLLDKSSSTDMQNSQLGSDEILARIRIEYEFETAPDDSQITTMCEIILRMELYADDQKILPCVPYTTLLDKMVPRKFEREQKIIYDDKQIKQASIKKWAFKLDGVRGRGLFMRNFCIIQTDDMRLYSTKCANLFTLNNIVAFQCEIMENENIYITDLLQVFKYKYNNRRQYECGIQSSYAIHPETAIECINHMHETIKNVMCNDIIPHKELCFQHFFDPPLRQTDYTTVPVDGYVVLDEQLHYVKYKWIPTVELEYDESCNIFKSATDLLNDRLILSNIKLIDGHIYECALTDDSINVLKHRLDRIVPN